jgi:hypothetical protein
VDEALAQLVGLALQLVFALVRGAALVLAQQVGLVEIKVDGARRHLEDCGARAREPLDVVGCWATDSLCSGVRPHS